jgi:hypothetical protein
LNIGLEIGKEEIGTKNGKRVPDLMGHEENIKPPGCKALWKSSYENAKTENEAPEPGPAPDIDGCCAPTPRTSCKLER